jgi:predicted nucleic-acid-binding protein
MIGVDTNVIVRLIVNDDLAQVERAARLFAANEILIPSSVLIETEWVLSQAYGLNRSVVADAIGRVIDLANVTVDEPQRISWALAAFAEGMDFADAVHVRTPAAIGRFASFDKALVKAARRRQVDAFEP